MTPLRQQMIRELELHRKPANTVKAYVSAVAQLAAYYHRSPEQISVEEIRSFIHRMITQRHWAATPIAWRSRITGCCLARTAK